MVRWMWVGRAAVGRTAGRTDGRTDGRTGKKVRFKEKRPFGSDGSGLDAGFHPLDADFRPLDAIHICQELKKFALGKKGLHYFFNTTHCLIGPPTESSLHPWG